MSITESGITENGVAASTAGADREKPPPGVLQVNSLAVDLGGRRVLRDVELTLAAGELTGLIGPNGAGKTTLLRAILSLTRISGGTITIAGRPAAPGAGGIGYVPQRHEFAWDFPISVYDVVMSGRNRRIGWFRRPGLEDHRAVAEALDRAGMSDLSARPVGQLSGGQRQRVLVARSLALRPEILLLDEPFTGLDMPTQEQLTGLFRGLADEGKAVLMTTHDLLGAMHTCDRLCLINRTIVATGAPAELTDADLWIRTFDIARTNPLLRALGVN